MNIPEPYTLDVREQLRNGGEPFPQIMQAVGQLAPEQPLRLLATFEPLPLYAVLGKKGYGHSALHRADGDWEVLFTPGQAATQPAPQKAAAAATATNADWPAPTAHLDNRGLQPPEPMILILEALEHLAPGEVLAAINERDPVFLYPELEARGATIRTEQKSDGVHLLIRKGVPA